MAKRQFNKKNPLFTETNNICYHKSAIYFLFKQQYRLDRSNATITGK